MKKSLLSISLLLFLHLTARAQWISQPLGFSTPVLVYEMEAVSNNVVWAAGADTINNAGQTYIKSTDGGLTWQSGPVTNSLDFIVNNITATDANTAWVAMVDNQNGGGMIKKTTNGGQTWVTQGTNTFTNAASYPDIIHFFDANNGVVFGDPVGGYWEIYRTTDGGTTWTRLPQASVPNFIMTSNGPEFGMFAKAIIGDTMWVGTSEGRIFRSINKGLTWAAMATPLWAVQAIAFTDAMNGLAMSDIGELVTTSNGGTTWTSVSFQGDLFDYDMAAVPNTPGVFVSTGFSGGFAGSSYTKNGGLTWVPLDSMPHMAVAFASDQAGWTSGAGSRTSYRWNSAILGTGKSVTMQEASVYPNPSNGVFYVNNAGTKADISVIDITGRQVFVAEKVQGNYALNLSHLPKGVYQLLIRPEKSVKRQKLVLE